MIIISGNHLVYTEVPRLQHGKKIQYGDRNRDWKQKNKYNLATQIQHGDTKKTWGHKYNKATQIQHSSTNATWQLKYKIVTKIL